MPEKGPASTKWMKAGGAGSTGGAAIAGLEPELHLALDDQGKLAGELVEGRSGGQPGAGGDHGSVGDEGGAMVEGGAYGGPGDVECRHPGLTDLCAT